MACWARKGVLAACCARQARCGWRHPSLTTLAVITPFHTRGNRSSDTQRDDRWPSVYVAELGPFPGLPLLSLGDTIFTVWLSCHTPLCRAGSLFPLR